MTDDSPEIIAVKVAEVVKCMRRLWPKYDQDLDQQVNEKQLIIRFMEHSFADAKLHEDFQRLLWMQRELSLDDLIYQEAGIDNSHGQNMNKIDQELALNQAQIINVTKRFYGDKTGQDPRQKRIKGGGTA